MKIREVSAISAAVAAAASAAHLTHPCGVHDSQADAAAGPGFAASRCQT
jgi:hypothetical protein